MSTSAFHATEPVLHPTGKVGYGSDRYFGIFGKGLGNGPSVFDWMLFGLGVLATIALAILVIRKTKPKFAEENPT